MFAEAKDGIRFDLMSQYEWESQTADPPSLIHILGSWALHIMDVIDKCHIATDSTARECVSKFLKAARQVCHWELINPTSITNPRTLLVRSAYIRCKGLMPEGR
jgi:hypothetical protein